MQLDSHLYIEKTVQLLDPKIKAPIMILVREDLRKEGQLLLNNNRHNLGRFQDQMNKL